MKQIKKRFIWGGVRQKTAVTVLFFCILFCVILLAGMLVNEEMLAVDLNEVFRMPEKEHLFGTDWVGRDMFYRTLKGIGISMRVGLLSAGVSAVIATVLGIAGPVFGGTIDGIISWFIDFVLSVPHTIAIILISLACGGGVKGIVVGVAATHWTSLTRVIRAEVLQIKDAEYTKISRNLGKSGWYIAREHIFPHVLPQLVVGVVLVFPHAILHEASITFLGFGLPAHEPAIGVILSESMRYLTGKKWWLALFPGLCLVGISLLVDCIGKNLERLLHPKRAQE